MGADLRNVHTCLSAGARENLEDDVSRVGIVFAVSYNWKRKHIGREIANRWRTDTVYSRILVPLDGSEVAEGALAHAVQMADIFGAEILLLRVVFLPPVVQQNLAEAQRMVMSEGEVYLNGIACQLRKPGRRVRTIVHWGKAAESIIAYAVQHEVSAVVMATHGHSGLEQWPLGSVAEKVLRSMQVPVLLVRTSQPLAAEAGKGG